MAVNSPSDVRRYPRGEQVLSAVADAITKMYGESLAVQSRIDIDDILTTVASAIAERMPVTCMAILMQGDPDTSRVVFADHTNDGMATYLDGYISAMLGPGEAPTTGLSRKVIESGVPFVVPKMGLDGLRSMASDWGQRYVETHPLPIDVDSLGYLMVPMRSGPPIIGTLALIDWRCRAGLTDGDIDWMQRAADRVGVTVDNAQFRSRAIDRAERIAAMSEVALAVTSTQDLRVTFKLILERVTATLRVEAADVLLVDEDKGTVFVAASTGFRTGLSEVHGPMPTETGRQWVVGHNVAAPGAIDWIGQSRRWLIAREGLKSYTASPIQLRENFVGALEVFSRSTLKPDQEWLDFLDAMANLAAVAYDNTSAHESLRKAGQGQTPRHAPGPHLSDREREILQLIVNGASNREAAEKLHLSQNTIKFHVRQLLEKSQVANRTELASKALHEGWAS